MYMFEKGVVVNMFCQLYHTCFCCARLYMNMFAYVHMHILYFCVRATDLSFNLYICIF